MSNILIFAIVAITLALIFYTIGVFSERKAKNLKKNHVIIFWLGLICDTTGTLTMSKIAKSGADTMSAMGLTLHGITGFLAIVLMLFHAIWATWVLNKNEENKKETFHKFSIVVWLIWLIPYFIGMILGMKV
ncbi:HsmA family protein [Terrisporobacter petrolearius]|uniref:HsmA family protein n=1 Tax=Terrisporobacter petrolearius TaxID=1460447 RepID=UPI0031CCBFD9